MTEFITRDYGQKEFEVIIKTDNKDHYKATEDFARKLIDHAKPQTNADRIRAMSDEEFSCFLAIVENRKTGKTIFDNTSDFWLEWLKQPAEGE